MSGKDHLKNDKNQNQVNKPTSKINQPTPELVGQFDSLTPNPAVSLPNNHEPIRTKQILRLQKSVGNRHVSRKFSAPAGGHSVHQTVAFPTVQRDMEVSEEGNELEEEADQVAKSVMRQGIGAAAPAGDDDEGKPVIQAKMQVNEPNDAYEQEADAVAAQVMRMNDEEEISRQPLALPSLQRKGSSAPTVTPEIEEEVNGLQSGGSPLPKGEQQFFESRMGADFSDVRIHNDSNANNLSNDLEAKAFTVGSSIAFNEGEYQPGSASGRELLAHELTHVVQQGAAPQQEEEVSRKPLAVVQREGDEGAGEESDEPTPEEEAAAKAAAERAEAIAAQARSTGINETNQSAGDAQTSFTAGEGPKQEVVASVSKGPVNQEKEKSQQAATESLAATNQTEKAAVETAVAEKAPAPAPAPAPVATAAIAQEEQAGSGSPEGATSTAQATVSGSFTTSENPPDKAPSSPSQDSAYVNVQGNVKETGAKEKTHGPAAGEASEAQAAAVSPQAELTGQAQAVQVGQMEQTETPGFDGAAFKAQLMERIASLTPSNVEEADEFKEDDKLGGVKTEMQGQVDTERTASQGPLENKTEEPPNLANSTPKPVTPLTVNDPGAQPGNVGADQAVPKPKGAGEVEKPLAESSQAMDQQMADAQVTDTQLENSNEPEFTSALESKRETQKEVAATPAEYRSFENNQISQAKTEAVSTTQQGLAGMHDDRTSGLASVDQQQTATKSEDEKKREQIAADINGLYESTKTKVEAKLSGLDDEVNRVFDEGAVAAKKAFEDFVDAKMEAYKEDRYGGWLGWAKWAKDKLFGMPDEVNSFYSEGRQLYIDKMDAVIDNIIAIISTTLAEAKAEVAQGKKNIQTYVDQLPEDCKQIGLDAQQEIQGQFDQLEENINNKQNDLVDSLAQKYVENLQAIDARIEEMKEANKGLVDKVIDAIGAVIETILKLKNLLLEALASAANAIMAILEDPIGFISNLISAIRQGLNNFVSNITTHLQTGFVEWLTGTMGEAGIQMPEDIFSLEGVLDLSLQVLGLTWENFRARAVGIFGENIVSALETGFDIFIILQQEGIMGLWDWIKDKLSSLKDQVIDGIQEMLITEVIEAGIQWIIGLIGGPAGAFIKAVQTIYNVVMWFIDNAERIASLISAISSAITEIAAGNLAGAAKYVEDSLARFVPTAIGFLASLLGLGDMGKKVRKVIDRIQEPVNNAIDSVLTMIKDFVKKIGKMLGFGGEGTDGGEIGEEVQFSAEGESHRLFVEAQGGQARLMVASEPMTVEQRLANWQTRVDGLDEERKGKAQGLLAQAKTLTSGADESADFLAQKKQTVKKVEDGPKIQQEQNELEREQQSLSNVLKQLFEIFGDEAEEEIEPGKVKDAYAQAATNVKWGQIEQTEEEGTVQRMALRIKDAGVMKTHSLEMTEKLVPQVAAQLGVPEKIASTGKANPDYSDLRNTVFRLHEEGRSFNSLAELVQAVEDGLNVKRDVRAVDWTDPNVQDTHPEKEEFLDLFASFMSSAGADKAWNLTIQGIQKQRALNLANRKHDPNQYYADLAAHIAPHLTSIPPVALWSGGIDVSLYARSLGYTTLESTQAGKVYDSLKLFEDFKPLGPLWNNLSRQFVTSMTGEVHIFMRVYAPDSVLFRQELPELNSLVGTKVSGVKWHVLRNWTHADLKEVNAQGNEVNSYTFNSYEEAVQVLETSTIKDDQGQSVNDAQADDIKLQLRKQLLTSMPYIGSKRADALLARFATMDDLRNASISDLESVPGIGSATAQKIYDYFH